MRKITIAALALSFSGSFAFAQSTSSHEVEAQRVAAGPLDARTQTVASRNNGAETPIWSENFANGIPSTWVNAGFNGFGAPLANALWEYRGPTTTPNNTVGSRGAYMTAQTPIASPTASNGFVIFDSDFLDNAGVAGNFGNGIAPAPHVGTLTTPTINLSTSPYVELKFNSYHRYFEGRALVAISINGGTTWPDTIAVHPGIAVNSATATNAVATLNISSIAGNQANVKFRFIFDGNYDDPGASGSGQGYYFWIIDDIEVNALPQYELRYTTFSGAPAQDIIFGPDAGSSKMGIVMKNQESDQTRDVEFDANVFNYGWGTVGNVKLTVDVLDANGTLITSYTSTGAASLTPGDTADYNTLNTYNNPWNPNAVGTYGIVYKVTSNNAPTLVTDTFVVRVTDSIMGLDFGAINNRIGTPNIGADGSALAVRIDLTSKATMKGVYVGLDGTTVAGGVLEVEVFDSTGFDFITGYPTSALKATSSGPVTITAADITNRYVNIPVTDGSNPYAILQPGAYYVSVKMYSNSGASPVYLRNDASFPQPAMSKIMYYTLSTTAPARWYTGFNNSSTVNAMWIRPRFYTSGIGIEEELMSSNISVAPNPATDVFSVTFEDLDGEFTLTLTDITGRVVRNENISVFGAARHMMDVNGLAKGVYMLNISNGKASVTHKISVQ